MNHNIKDFGEPVAAALRREPERNQIKNMILPLLAEMIGSNHVGLAAMGAGIGVGLTGLGAASAVGRNPGAATPILVQAILAIAFTEAIVFYALYLLPH
jgi:F-type H+-transporting ATPase subunit c